MKKIILGLSLVISLFASIESEVENLRFSYKNGVLTDNFANMQWQDNNNAKTIQKNWQGAKDYCKNLTLGGKNDWRLPNKSELKYAYEIKYAFRNVASHYYCSSSEDVSYSSYSWFVRFHNGYTYSSRKSDECYVRCVRAGQYDTLRLLEKEIQKIRSTKIRKKYLPIYNKVKIKNTIEFYTKFIKKYPNAPQLKEARENLFKQYNILYENEYKKVETTSNISGYEWFISKYPKAPQVKQSIKNIHKLAFAKAKEINTISSYNTFIISYPYASQVRDANDKAYKLESSKYNNMKKNDERKARLLAVKIKKLTILMDDMSNKSGYTLVKNRMVQLLTEQYEETDASLRYYESKEFTDFTRVFKNTMSDISRKLGNIERYSSEILSTSKQGFEDAKVDRAMSRYKNEEHTKWEKRMHLREKGYN